jgi:hypothetical protein
MLVYRFVGIPDGIAAAVRTTHRSPQYGHPAHRELARGYGPCRVCLRTFREGEEDRILFTYQPFLEPGSLPAPGPVFIHADECRRYDDLALPPDLRALPLVIEGYQNGGQLVRQERVNGEPVERVLHRTFENGGVDYVHIRNGEAGCFMARVECCFACS